MRWPSLAWTALTRRKGGPGVTAADAAVEELQRSHYDAIATRYDAHYSDPSSMRYRERFILGPLFSGIDLRGATVLEAMCGSGQAVGFLQARGARVIGLDIAPSQVDLFRSRWASAEVRCRSIFDTGLESSSLDGVLVLGALHHLHPRLPSAIDEIFRILKPGGHFCFMEPHASSWIDAARRAWYRLDPLFAANEAAIDYDRLRRQNEPRFAVVRQAFAGSVGYLLVLQSLVFRVSPRIKRLYAPLLMGFERVATPLVTERTGCVVLAVWRKT